MNAIYARQSIDKKDSLSVDGQIELCARFAGDEVRIYEDRGFSGKNTKRPAFTRLIEDVKAGQVQKIYVYRLDRFSRSIADFSQLWQLLEVHGVEFNSVTEHFDTSSPIGRAMLNIVLVFAQLERETTAERVRDNYIHRFSLGAWPGGPAPYGYELAKTADAEGRAVPTLLANEKAEVVRRIFADYARSGVSLRKLARVLTAEGIHGPRRAAWDNVTLSRILHSPVYVKADEEVYRYYLAQGMQIKQSPHAFDGIHACGVIGRRERGKDKYNGVQAQILSVSNHEGIVEPLLWLQVQRKLAGNTQLSRENAGKYSWLTGRLKCAKCGYAVKINRNTADGRFYLICSGRSNLSCCDAVMHIELSKLEEAVAQLIKEALSACPAENVCPGGRAAELLDVERKIERLVSALAESSAVSAQYISREIDRLHRKREGLISRSLKACENPQRLDFDSASFEDKKLISSMLIDKILLDDDRAEIRWKF